MATNGAHALDPADPSHEGEAARHAFILQNGLAGSPLAPEWEKALEGLLRENAALQEQLRSAEALAERDPLTCTLNRRSFMQALHRSISIAERYKTDAAVVYLDLDGFKAINDSHGHQAGDAVLKHVARLLSETVRESDVVGRLGGDEFGLILARAGPQEAAAKASALVSLLESRPCEHLGVRHRVSASVGVHALRAKDDPEDALARADEAMYAEKFARRRRDAAKAG